MANMTRFREIRTLAAEKIQEITITDKSFVFPKNFKPDELLETAFDIVYEDPINVRIRFSSNQARYIKGKKMVKDSEYRERAGWFNYPLNENIRLVGCQKMGSFLQSGCRGFRA